VSIYIDPNRKVLSTLVKNQILLNNLTALSRLNEPLARQLSDTSIPSGKIEFLQTKQNALTARYQGAFLASRVKPLDEADRLANSFDPIEHAVVSILGFGLGYHIKAAAERLKGTGFIVVFEPDLALLRSVFENIDCSDFLTKYDIYFFTQGNCRPEIYARLDGRIAIVAQGTKIIEHPPSRNRLGHESADFSKSLAEAVAAMRTTLTTTLVHSVTTCRNLCLNLDYYGAGQGIESLHNWAKNHPAVLIAAGPSLSRNLSLLENPDIKKNTVILAVQTALKPLLARGIKPHFVTALDYHEISKQFYEGLTAQDVEGITLICEPKANRAILESYPGRIRCVGNRFLNQLLGPIARTMGYIKPGATVAHLNFVLAQYFGCDPIIFIGQDLGFTEGLYYGPNAAIHEQWAPELNRFNTIEMMEWQRIARMKLNLREDKDHDGNTILVDEQMATYRKLFEAEFASAPQRIIDATEGGTVKQHTEIIPLHRILEETKNTPPLAPLPDQNAPSELDPSCVRAVRKRLRQVRQEVVHLQEISQKTTHLLDTLLDHLDHGLDTDTLFDEIDHYRLQVDAMPETMDLVGQLNQLGIFNRIRADRAITLSQELDEIIRQRKQVERDKVNVLWIGDASSEFLTILDEADRVLRGEKVDTRISRPFAESTQLTNNNTISNTTPQTITGQSGERPTSPPQIAALIAADPKHNGLLLPRHLDESFLNRSILQGTLERLNQCQSFDTIVIIVPQEYEVESIINTKILNTKQVIIHRSPTPLYDARHAVVAAGRRWSESSWRGGIGGLTIFDEIICPKIMTTVMEQHNLDAALVVGPDWPLLDPSEETGCDAVVNQFRALPDRRQIVFTQAPPGLVGCVISKSTMAELACRDHRQTVGALLTYIPHLPQRDPVTLDMCVKLPANIRNRTERISFDSEERIKHLCKLFEPIGEEILNYNSNHILEMIPQGGFESHLPHEIELELTTDRLVTGPPASLAIETSRPPITQSLLRRITDECSERCDTVITLRGLGDPLLHPEFSDIIKTIRRVGISAIHLHTDLLKPEDLINKLLHLPIEVISVNVNADKQAVYRNAMSEDCFPDLIANLERLINRRAAMNDGPEFLALPWIVPTLARSEANHSNIQPFFDRWVYFLNAAVIEPPPVDDPEDHIIKLPVPQSTRDRRDREVMLILSDGSVPLEPDDRLGVNIIGNINDKSVSELWRTLLDERRNRKINITNRSHNTSAAETPTVITPNHSSAVDAVNRLLRASG